jgi:hypothetical protein
MVFFRQGMQLEPEKVWPRPLFPTVLEVLVLVWQWQTLHSSELRSNLTVVPYEPVQVISWEYELSWNASIAEFSPNLGEARRP